MRAVSQDAEFLAELKDSPRWLLWRYETRNGGKQTKVPYCARGGRASSTDSGSWCSYEEAAAVANLYDGIGFAIGDGTALIDLDGCRDLETGLIESWAQSIIAVLDAPAEVSPSKEGVHIYVKSWKAGSVKRMFGTGEKKRGIEIYPSGRYAAITFERVPGTPDEMPERDLSEFTKRVEHGDFDPEDVRETRMRESCERWEHETNYTLGGATPSFDLVSWIAAYNVPVVEHKSSGVIVVACPGTHGGYDVRDGRAFLKQFPSGAVAAGCLHQTCSLSNSNGNRWREFRRLVEGDGGGMTPDRPHKTDASAEAVAPPRFSEDDLALHFTERHHADLRYVAKWGRWLQYDGARWREDSVLDVFDKCRIVCREASDECMADGKHALAKRVTSASTIAAVHRIAASDPRTAATVDQWDSSLYLLNTPGGAVDLCTGEMRPCVREDFCTKITAVAPGGACPLWRRFLGQVTDWNAELEGFLQRMVGYSLTGCTREECLFFLYGLGANGKSKFLGAISGMLGSYARTAPIETFVSASGERHPTDLAGLQGARFVTAIETEQDRRWAESKIKTLTGGDPISARFMRQDFFEYIPQFKLVIAGNHKPALRSVNEAIRRRFHLLPFSVTIPEAERDPDLADKLRAEWAGILQWAIDGCVAWHRDGLNPPAIVKDATAAYLAAEDHIARWIEDCCLLGDREVAKTKALYKSYCAWCEANNEKALSSKEFSPELDRKGYEVEHTVYGNVRRGIGLRSESHEGN